MPRLVKRQGKVLLCQGAWLAATIDRSITSLPSYDEQLQWCLEQPTLSHDKEFISLLLNQFSAASIQLERIAARIKIEPLALCLEDLIRDALQKEN